MPDITLCTPVYEQPDAIALMWESFLKFHPRDMVRWHVCVDKADDEGRLMAYLEGKADRIIVNDPPGQECGRSLETLFQSVETKWTLTVDSDVEFHRELPLVEWTKGIGIPIVAIAPPHFPLGVTFQFGVQFHAAPRIEHWCTFWNTHSVQWLLDRGFSCGFIHDFDNRLCYDCMGLIALGFRARNLAWIENGIIIERVKHFGGISTVFKGINDRADRYRLIQERLRLLRGGA